MAKKPKLPPRAKTIADGTPIEDFPWENDPDPVPDAGIDEDFDDIGVGDLLPEKS